MTSLQALSDGSIGRRIGLFEIQHQGLGPAAAGLDLLAHLIQRRGIAALEDEGRAQGAQPLARAAPMPRLAPVTRMIRSLSSSAGAW